MKILIPFSVAVIAFLVSSCVAPVNLNYESARMLQKGQVELQGGASAYADPTQQTNSNFGGRVGYGFSNVYNLKIRGEAIIPVSSYYDDDWLHEFKTSYFEIDNKFGINKFMAVSLPLGIYSLPGKGNDYGVFDPRLIFTARIHDVFEVSVIPKAHIFFGGNHQHVGSFVPALSVGLGISSDLNKWAIRPEVGFDTHISAGVGLSIFLGGEK